MRIRRNRDDRGAMLVIALIIITTVALVTGLLLSRSWTNLQATTGLRGVAGTAYAADTAAKLAIDDLRLGATSPTDTGASYPSADWVYNNNIDGTGCFGLTGTAPRTKISFGSNLYPRSGSQATGTSARVECAPVQGTGLFGGGGGVDTTNGFARAITTFNGNLALHDNDEMQIRGGIAVSGDLITHPGRIFTNGYVKVSGNCPNPGEITSTPPAQCNQGGSFTDPVVGDPVSGNDITNGTLVWRDAASQVCSAFEPGYYDDAAALTAKTTSCGTATFKPGTYYFDFHNDLTDVMHTDLMGGSSVWNITGTVIGGMPGGATMPGRCHNPIDEDNVSGVRFVFGSSSRMTVSASGHVELCAATTTDGSTPIALQQLSSGGTPAVTGPITVTASAAPSTAGSTPAFTGTPTANALSAVGGGTAVWSSPSTGNPTAALKLTGFTPATAIPQGSILTAAQLVVTHREVQNAGSPTFKPINVKVTAGPSSINADLNAAQQATMTSDTVPFAANALRQLLDDSVRAGTLSAALPTIDLTVTGAKKMDYTFDAVELRLTYYRPVLRAGTQVKFLVGAPNGSGDASEFMGDFLVHGGTYAPQGLIDFDVHGSAGYVAFRWGIAAREIDLSGHPGVPYGYPLVSIPDDGTGFGRRVTVVDLKVFVCVQQATCTSGGTQALTIRVKITDPPWPLGGRPTPAKRQIEVLSWAEEN